jgi:hypothetical protein
VRSPTPGGDWDGSVETKPYRRRLEVTTRGSGEGRRQWVGAASSGGFRCADS